MKTIRRWGPALLACGLLAAVGVTAAERPPRPPFGGGERGQRVQPLTGEITAIADDSIKIRLLPQPGDMRGRRLGRQQAAGPAAQQPEITIQLAEETAYRILDTADEEAIATGLPAIAVGLDEGEEDHLTAKALCLYAADDPVQRALPVLMGTMRRLMVDVGADALRQRLRPRFAAGQIEDAAPLSIRGRSREGGQVTYQVELTDQTKIYAIDECLYEDLQVGQWASVVPLRARKGDGDAAGAPGDIVAATVLLMEPVNLREVLGQRARPGGAPPAQ